jgi:hypothetical protein
MKTQLVLAATRRLHHPISRRKPLSLRRFLENPAHYMHVLALHVLHILEIVAIAGASVMALYLAVRLTRLLGVRRLARAGTRFEVTLPEEPDRYALVHLFRALAELLHPRLLRPAPWFGFAFLTSGKSLTVELFCSRDVPAEDVQDALAEALRGASVERCPDPELRGPAGLWGSVMSTATLVAGTCRRFRSRRTTRATRHGWCSLRLPAGARKKAPSSRCCSGQRPRARASARVPRPASCAFRDRNQSGRRR